MIESKTNKPIYVNKYDYMHYYTRCEEVWFLSNQEIEERLKLIEYPLKKELNITDDIDDSNDEDSDSDDYEALEEDLLNENLDDKKILEISDPKILEGLIIDQKAKEFIISYYEKQVANDFICVIDYDEINKEYQFKEQNIDNEDLNFIRAQQTQNDINLLLSKNKKFILFQPTFISETLDKHAKYVTRCDCIVYLNRNQCYLIEVKGTSNSKIIHLLDLLYQKNVLASSLLHITNYYVCLVKYMRSEENKIPFIINPFINPSKDSANISKSKDNFIDLMLNHAFTESDGKELEKQLKGIDGIKTNWKQDYKLGKQHLLINDALNNDLNFDLMSLSYLLTGNPLKKATNWADDFISAFREKINPLIDNFNHVINKLSHAKTIYQKINNLNLVPCKNCTSCYKNCDFWNRCKKIFKYQYLTGDTQLLPFGYSSYVFKDCKSDDNANLTNDDDSSSNESANSQFHVYDAICNQLIDLNNPEWINLYVNDAFIPFFRGENNNEYMLEVKELWDKLQSRPNRVYFDFESINSAIPAMDEVFPLTQVVTQNSVIKTEIKDDDYYYEYENVLSTPNSKECKDEQLHKSLPENNMIRDPAHLNIDWYKSIVNKLIDTKHPKDTCWYVVYNKTFESNRLHEMDLLIKEREYHDKIEEIRNNIFDLEDFFNTQQKEKKILAEKLHGFYSIKDILPLIPKQIQDETGTMDYHSGLDIIHNGQQAQAITTKRFLNNFKNMLFHDKTLELMPKKEWNQVAKDLQKYCENDVRAMIAVEKYIKQEFIDKLPKQ